MEPVHYLLFSGIWQEFTCRKCMPKPADCSFIKQVRINVKKRLTDPLSGFFLHCIFFYSLMNTQLRSLSYQDHSDNHSTIYIKYYFKHFAQVNSDFPINISKLSLIVTRLEVLLSFWEKNNHSIYINCIRIPFLLSNMLYRRVWLKSAKWSVWKKSFGYLYKGN